MKKIILSVVVISFAFLSCKKDKTCDLNTGNFVGSYKVTSFKYKADASTPEIDEFTFWDACEKDDLVIFNANNTITYSDAGLVCTPDGNGTGIWTLSGSAINIDGQVGTVSHFDCNGTTITIAGTTAGELTTVSLSRQ